MNKKIMATAIVLTFIIGAQMVFIFWFYRLNVYLQLEHNALLSDYDKLQSDKNSLQLEYASLQSDYHGLNSDYHTLNNTYRILVDDYAQLNQTHQILMLEYNELNASYRILAYNYTELKQDHDDLSLDYAVLEQDFTDLSNEYVVLQGQYASLFSDYNALLEASNEPLSYEEIPSTYELENWLFFTDETDEIQYSEPNFVCGDFAVMLSLHAKLEHWDMGVVGVFGYDEFYEPFDHAFNAMICDEGLVYIEPQTDEVWWYSNHEEISEGIWWEFPDFGHIYVEEYIIVLWYD